MDLKNYNSRGQWQSLCGTLSYKSSEGLSKLFKRKLWFVLDDCKSCLSGYKSSQAFKTNPSIKASVTIELNNAGIFLNPLNNGELTIICADNEHFLASENQESITIWMFALQSVRNRNYGVSSLASSLASAACNSVLQGSKEMHPQSQPHKTKPRSVSLFPNAMSPTFYRKTLNRKTLENFKHNSLESGIEHFRNKDCTHSQDTVDSAFENDQNWQPLPSDRRISDGTSSELYESRRRSCLRAFSGSLSDIACAQQQGQPTNEQVNHMFLLEKQVITSKTMVAELMNNESIYKELIEEKEEQIRDLKKKLACFENSTKKSAAEVALKHKLEGLQQQVIMQYTELKKLTSLKAEDLNFMHKQQCTIDDLNLSLASWKSDYVFLLQSSINTTHENDDKSRVFGGNVHKQRVRELLEEARVFDPSLPDYDILALQMTHVDKHGFKHFFDNEYLLLHYLCQQLQIHYKSLYPEQQNCLQVWKELLSSTPSSTYTSIHSIPGIKGMCRQGLPMQFRSLIWKLLTQEKVAQMKLSKGNNYFKHLVTRAYDSLLCGYYRKQIFIDLLRTMPNNLNYSTADTEGIRKLKEVLQAFSFHNPSIGYCQGLNFIASMLLLFMDSEDAFWALVAITEEHFESSYFDRNLTGAHIDQEIFQELLQQLLPSLHSHIKSFDIEFSTITINWFLSLFIDSVPFQTLLRIWDCFLIEGPKVLFRFALAILKINENLLLAQKDVLGLLKSLKRSTKMLFDVDGLVKIAFEELKPFPKRQCLSWRREHFRELFEKKKNTFYTTSARNNDKATLEQKKDKADAKIDNLTQQCSNGEEKFVLKYIDAAPVSYNISWVVCGSQELSNICLVNSNMKTMQTKLQLKDQVLCMLEVGGLVVVSTLSKQLIAYHGKQTDNKIWSFNLQENSYSLCHRLIIHPEQSFFSIFAGLDNGVIAFFEKIPLTSTSSASLSLEDPLYLPICHSPITSVLLVDPHIWVANENTIHVIHSETLNTAASFQVSRSCIDMVRCMVLCDPYHYQQHPQLLYQQKSVQGKLDTNKDLKDKKSVNNKSVEMNKIKDELKYSFQAVWISMEGSSVLQCWQTPSYACIFLFDVAKCFPVLHFKEEDYFNTNRITSVLCFEKLLWVGTGCGNVYIFSIIPPTTLPILDGSSSSFNPSNKKGSLPQNTIHKQIHKLKKRATTLPFDENQIDEITDENEEEKITIKEKPKISETPKAKECEENGEENIEEKTVEISNSPAVKVERNKTTVPPTQSSFGNLHAQMRFPSVDFKTENNDEDDLQEFIKELKCLDKAMKLKKYSESGENEDELFKKEKLPRRASAFGDYYSKNDTKKCADNNDDDVFTESESGTKNNKFIRRNSNKWLASSFNSFLVLDSKIKVSEKPVRCIRLIDSHPSNITILTCAGNFGNDKSVLIWKKDDNKNKWVREEVENTSVIRKESIVAHEPPNDAKENNDNISPFDKINRRLSIFFGKS